MHSLLFSITKRDLEIQTFRAGGKGGQNQNKVSSGVRVIHLASGARGEARDSRDQLRNKHEAFKRMTQTPTFKTWLKVEIARRAGQQALIEEQVERDMRARNLRVEGVVDGRWEECSLEDMSESRGADSQRDR